MKIASNQSNAFHSIDIADTIKEFENKYRTIYWTILEGDLYIYKPIGRKEYKDIVSKDISNEDKQDMFISKCVIYPEDFDPDDCVAGVIDILFNKALEVSYLDSIESKNGVTEYYRQEMFEMDNQITCIINEAFPNFDIEEIENWDIERTAKYLSRAEFKLQNFRGFVFNEDYFEANPGLEAPQEEEQPAPVPEPKVEVKEKTVEKGKKQKLTPEKLRQLQAQFPGINWGDDAGFTEDIESMKHNAVDTLAPALRPGMF